MLTENRVAVAAAARGELQGILDRFDVGIQISSIELQDVTPPEKVKPAFNEVNRAEQERERLINEAEKRRNQVLPLAEGDAKRVIAESQEYALERINGARGEAARFDAILAEYLKVPEVTKQRLYLEMIDEVLPRVGRLYMPDADGATPPLPLLNLSESTAILARQEGGAR